MERTAAAPMSDPEKGPNARSAQTTNPPFPGIAVESSAVMSDSGTAQMTGKMRKLSSANSRPADCDAIDGGGVLRRRRS
uniref:Uncharacterized protein n=1 Tax=Oryza sativa subsp. japonica TaxID=39947 RepID=H2KX63_ORYSJ|nr:hypothetical protein LOC_Os12g41634 [Oryza sativa Japonica Group]